MILWVSVFVAFLATGVLDASQSLRCEYGKSVYCSTFMNAIQCNKLDECLAIWKSSRWVEKNTTESSDCNLCVNSFRAPHQFLRPTVRSAPHMFMIPELLRTHDALQNSTRFCGLLMQCEIVPVGVKVSAFKNTMCKDCRRIIDDVKTMIADSPISSKISQFIKQQLCGHLPEKYYNYCIEAAEEYIPYILQYISAEIDSEKTCEIVGFCPDTALATTEGPGCTGRCESSMTYSWINRPAIGNNHQWHSRLVESDTCQTCLSAVQNIQFKLSDKSFQEEIKTFVLSYGCEHLAMKEMCERYVAEHYDDIMHAIITFDANQFCCALRQCSGVSDAAFDKRLVQQIVMSALPKTSLGIPGLCQICELFLHQIIPDDVTNETAEVIVDSLKQICYLLPEPHKKRCLTFIEEDLAVLINLLVGGYPPKLICSLLGLCALPPTALPTVVQTPLLHSDGCTFCKLAVDTIRSKITENATEEEIRQVLDKVCDYLPKSWEESCKDVIDKYTDVLVKLLVEQISAEAICKQIGFCKAAGTRCSFGAEIWCRQPEITRRCLQDPDCKAVMGLVQPSIRHLTDGIQIVPDCSKLITLSEKCADLRTARRCGHLRECHSYRRSFRRTPNCRYCVSLLQQVRIYNFPALNCDLAIDSDHAQLCRRIAAQQHVLRSTLKRSNMGEISICLRNNWCEKQSRPQFVFASRGPIVPQRVGALGDNPCTWGPSYWCRSEARALRCNSLDHCRLHVWKGEVPPSDDSTTTAEPEKLSTTARPFFVCNANPWQLCSTESLMDFCNLRDYCKAMGTLPSNEDDTESVHATPPPDVDCSRGITVWCQSWSNAVSCDKVDLCRAQVWHS